MTEQPMLEPVAVAESGPADAATGTSTAAEAGAFERADRDVRAVHSRRSQEMFGLARRLGLSDEDASDAVQETMLRLWRELDGGVDVLDLDAWVFRVLYRLAMDHHRLRRRVTALMDRIGGRARGDDDPPGAGDPEHAIEIDALWLEVDRLPERQRAVLYLRYRADLPYERIGIALSITPGAARGHASTGLATLRRRLGEEAER